MKAFHSYWGLDIICSNSPELFNASSLVDIIHSKAYEKTSVIMKSNAMFKVELLLTYSVLDLVNP